MDWSTLKFLIVDDAEHFRRLLTATLRAGGVRDLRMVADAKTALQVYQDLCPDVVITGWKLAGMNGNRLTRHIRNLGNLGGDRVPVIMLSGHREKKVVMEAVRSGVTLFLDKPISNKKLFAGITAAITKARQAPKRPPPSLEGDGEPVGKPLKSIHDEPRGRSNPRIFERPQGTPGARNNLEPNEAFESRAGELDNLMAMEEQEAVIERQKQARALRHRRAELDNVMESEDQEKAAELQKRAQAFEAATAAEEAPDDPEPDAAEQISLVIEEHDKWVQTGGQEGKRADFADLDLAGADLSSVNLAHIDLSRKDLSDANLNTANLEGSNLKRVSLSGGTIADANLRQVSLRHADLRGALLRDTDLSGADLAGSDLSGADFKGADLSGALMLGANIKGADLSGAKGLSQSQIDRAFGDSDTKLPPGLHLPSDD